MSTPSLAGPEPIRPLPAGVSLDDLQRRFALERALAERLRQASAEQRQTLYREVYDEYARTFPAAADGDDQGLELQWRLVAPFLAGDVEYLEFGPGSGALGLRVAPHCRSVTLVEASPTLERRAGPVESQSAVTWVSPDRAARDLPQDHYDFAFSCHFLEHLHPDDLAAHLELVRCALRPGGTYLAATPNRLSGPHDVSGYFHRRALGFHLREYSHSELAGAMRRAGFSDVRAWDGDLGGFEPTSWGAVRLREVALSVLGARLRRRWFERIRRRSPFRTLEQVVVSGRRS